MGPEFSLKLACHCTLPQVAFEWLVEYTYYIVFPHFRKRIAVGLAWWFGCFLKPYNLIKENHKSFDQLEKASMNIISKEEKTLMTDRKTQT